MLPFGIHKGKHYSEVSPTYLLFILGYRNSNKCILPKDKAGFAYRYPDLYNEIVNNIKTCIRCDNIVNKNYDKILCIDCYNKHHNNSVYRKTLKEKEFEEVILTEEHEILNNLIDKFNLVKLDKFIGSDNMWKQEKPCAICNKENYGCSRYSKYTKTNYNLCSDCFCKAYLNSDNFDKNIYNNYLDRLTNIMSNLLIIDLESALVTKKITEICIDLAKELNLLDIPEKKANKGIYFENLVYYDLELSYGTTKFIIEIDRTHNGNTAIKLDDAFYQKCIWIRWGEINNLDNSDEKIDVIKFPLNKNNGKWFNSQDINPIIKSKNIKKLKTLFDYGISKLSNNNSLDDDII